jgi:signal transduction histidine kinase
MRTLMRDLRGDGGESTPMLTPEALDALVQRTRAAGLQVELSVDGDPRPLPAGVDQAAFRVVQESLTNALRHSGAGHVEVHIGYQPTAIDIRVRDDGDGALPRRRREDVGNGHGQVGMRRRVDLLGGVFDARQTTDGFEVVARIPVEDQT